jgi:hypothetical protein
MQPVSRVASGRLAIAPPDLPAVFWRHTTLRAISEPWLTIGQADQPQVLVDDDVGLDKRTEAIDYDQVARLGHGNRAFDAIAWGVDEALAHGGAGWIDHTQQDRMRGHRRDGDHR